MIILSCLYINSSIVIKVFADVKTSTIKNDRFARLWLFSYFYVNCSTFCVYFCNKNIFSLGSLLTLDKYKLQLREGDKFKNNWK